MSNESNKGWASNLSTSKQNKSPGSIDRATIRERMYTFFILGIVLFCIILLVLHPLIKIEGKDLTTFGVNANIGWHYEDGSSADLEKLKFTNGKGTVMRDITSVFTSGKDFCFETSNLYFKVYLNDEQIYDFHPEIKFYYGKYYGDYTHFVNIPFFKGTGHLKIEYEALTINSWTSFRNASMTEGNDYLKDGISAGILEFALCFSSCIIGIIIMIMGVVFHTRHNGMVETVSLGSISILVACYLMAGTHIWQLLFMDSVMPRLAEYTSLALIPIPLILFVAAYTDNLDKGVPMAICTTSSTLFLLIFITMITGIFDYSVLLMAIHTNLFISMIMLVVFFLKAARNREKNISKHKWLVIAFLILMITGIIDVALYYIEQSKYKIQTVNFGLGIFIVILAVYEINNIVVINRKNGEAEMMIRLARVDGLTGLANRMSFDEAEKELSEDGSAKASLALLDINYLKTVNDLYGHSEGDRHIKAAAAIILNTFGKYGECFRIGGDEFFTIIKGEDHEKKIVDAFNNMTAEIDRYNREENPPIPLNIACGIAAYENGLNTVGEAEKLADTRMYTDKKRLKEDGINISSL
jgi:diguanylate cyclase (GGDEF)-like protein